MIEINNKKLCESCFSETDADVCPFCGYSKEEFVSDPTVLQMGTKLHNKIIIGRVMGRGGFGVTYLGYDERMERVIAVKEYYPNGIAYRPQSGTELFLTDTKSGESFEKGAEKFYTEAKMVAQFNGNPNIVSVYDYFRENNTVYLLMEYLDGITLKNYIKDNGKLPAGQALFVMDKIAAALSITHSAGILHRDISPDNIMLCSDGKVKLIDFGAARQIMAESSSNLTVVLKPGYTPIEQYTKKGRQGAWTDIYALGVSIYFALTGTVIDDPYERMENDDEFTENRHGINKTFWEILKKCTMIQADDRYSSAIELRKALSQLGTSLKPEPVFPEIEEGAAKEPVTAAAPAAAENKKSVEKKSGTKKPEEKKPENKKTEAASGAEQSKETPAPKKDSIDLKIENDPGLDLSVNVYENKKTGLFGNKKAVTAICSAAAVIVIGIIGIAIASSNKTEDITVDSHDVTSTGSEQVSLTDDITDAPAEITETEAETSETVTVSVAAEEPAPDEADEDTEPEETDKDETEDKETGEETTTSEETTTTEKTTTTTVTTTTEPTTTPTTTTPTTTTPTTTTPTTTTPTTTTPTTTTPTTTTPAPEKKTAVVSFSGESVTGYAGDYGITKKCIDRYTLNQFDGDVAITLDITFRYTLLDNGTIYGGGRDENYFIRAVDENGDLVDVYDTSSNMNYIYVTDYYSVYRPIKSNNGSITFKISKKAIDKISSNGEIHFQVYNILINSATVEPA